LIDEVATASSEQANGIEQINSAVARIDQLTQENAANAEQSASSSEQLSAQAEHLKKVIQDLIALVGSSNSDTGSLNQTMQEVPGEEPERPERRRSQFLRFFSMKSNNREKESGVPAKNEGKSQRAFPQNNQAIDEEPKSSES
jgi:methyl-accepting chemotaxis protein